MEGMTKHQKKVAKYEAYRAEHGTPDNLTCTKCGTRKAAEDFPINRANKTGRHSHCKECQAKKWAEKPGRPRKGRKAYEAPTEKFCRGCKQTLPASAFGVRHDRGDGKALLSRCKSCVSATHRQWRERNLGASRRRNLKSKYGIEEQEYLDLLEKQGGCGVCGNPDSGRKDSPWLHVDHCHTTGEIRGLLCHTCNILCGLIEKVGRAGVDKAYEWTTR